MHTSSVNVVYFLMHSLQCKKKKKQINQPTTMVCQVPWKMREVQENKGQAREVSWSLEDMISLFFRSFQVISLFTNDQALKIYISSVT